MSSLVLQVECQTFLPRLPQQQLASGLLWPSASLGDLAFSNDPLAPFVPRVLCVLQVSPPPAAAFPVQREGPVFL